MKGSVIVVGGIYHNGKDGVREVLSIDAGDTVAYKILSATKAKAWNTITKKMESVIGTTSTMSVTGFAAWSSAKLDAVSLEKLLVQVTAQKKKLSPGEHGFMNTLKGEIRDNKIAEEVVLNHDFEIYFNEARTVRALYRKGLVTLKENKAKFNVTSVGLAYLDHVLV